MSKKFRELELKPAYSSSYDNIVSDFYIPVLSSSKSYLRLAGYFSSSSLAIASRGILGLIKNGGVMKLVTSPKLNQKDCEIISQSLGNLPRIVEENLKKEIEFIENEFIRDHLFALGWMIANKKLEIKIAIPIDSEGIPLNYEEGHRTGIFHMKVGIFEDFEGNKISFNGSINETFAGWIENEEIVHVYKSWEPALKEHLNYDIEIFNSYWNPRDFPTNRRYLTLDFPEALKNKLIRDSEGHDIDYLNLKKYYSKKHKKIQLHDYQKVAVKNWINNGKKGIFEMATGSGKTFTSLACVKNLEGMSEPLLVIIACPQKHLVLQWKTEIEKFGLNYDDILILPKRSAWKNEFADNLIDLGLGNIKLLIVITTHATFSSNDFINIISDSNKLIKILAIVDEVHGIGAEKSSSGLIARYDYRLGLSATPERYFDEPGTEIIYNYFGDPVFQFTLEDALNTIDPRTGETFLCPYRYHPVFVHLNRDEIEQYIEETKRIAQKISKKGGIDWDDESFKRILIKRANLIKNAKEKLDALQKMLVKFNRNQKWTIIYTSPGQIEKVMKLINSLKNKFRVHRFTNLEDPEPSVKFKGMAEREYILEKFAHGEYQILIAMKCLDEGVDIPPARTAILLASSGNPREYIQRIGRLIRRHQQKEQSEIFDLIVAPSIEELPPHIKAIEQNIFEKELKRCIYIAKNAINNTEALKILYEEQKNLYN